jgi:hypothetical protein
MITAIVQFPLPDRPTYEEARELFRHAAPDFRHPEGLVRKYFLLSEDGREAGGVYLWQSREQAEGFYKAYAPRIVERFGREPSITYFHSPVVVDNQAAEVEVY